MFPNPRIRVVIDASLFKAISPDEQAKITSILKDTKLLSKDGVFGDDSSDIVDAEAASVIADPQNFIKDLTKKFSLCKTGCDVAAAAAAACTAGTAGIGLAACLAATEVARNACRDAC
jgi:hypothetical protein